MNTNFYISSEYEKWIQAVTRYQLAEARLNQRANAKTFQERIEAIDNLRSVASGLLDGKESARVHVDISRCGLTHLIYKRPQHANR